MAKVRMMASASAKNCRYEVNQLSNKLREFTCDGHHAALHEYNWIPRSQLVAKQLMTDSLVCF